MKIHTRIGFTLVTMMVLILSGCGGTHEGDLTIENQEDLEKAAFERFKKFFHGMLDEGIYLAPSAFEAGFVSAAHGDAEINATIDAAAKVFATL